VEFGGEGEGVFADAGKYTSMFGLTAVEATPW